MTSSPLYPFVGALIAFYVGKRLVRGWYLRQRLSATSAYYMLFGMQGMCIGVAVAASTWLELQFPRSLWLLMAVVSFVLLLLSTGAMLLFAHLAARGRKRTGGEYIRTTYGPSRRS